jgi:hypothetical protein
MNEERHPHYSLSRQAIKALGAIILTAIVGIIVLSAWSLGLRAGIAGSEEAATAINAGSADEALSILGNIASAAVGGLVGWLTRDMLVRRVSQEEMLAAKEEGEGL